jgi:hypothetical protein
MIKSWKVRISDAANHMKIIKILTDVDNLGYWDGNSIIAENKVLLSENIKLFRHQESYVMNSIFYRHELNLLVSNRNFDITYIVYIYMSTYVFN